MTRDGGKTWKQILRLSGTGVTVNTIAAGEGSSEIFAGTSEGLYASETGLARWKRIFRRPEAAEENISCVAVSLEGDLAVGTAAGLFVSPDRGMTWHRVPAFADRAVFQIEPAGQGRYLVSSSRGLFMSAKGFAGWRALYRSIPKEVEPSASDELDDGDPIQAGAMYFALLGESPLSILLWDGRLMLQSRDDGSSWESAGPLLGAAVSAAPVRLSQRGDSVLVPSLKGAYWVSGEDLSARPVEASLGSLPVYDLHYDSQSDTLLAAAGSGLFAMVHPEANVYFMARDSARSERISGVLERFSHEPTIQELQTVAMRYAEVHPEKILTWRADASRKAWLPKVGVGWDLGEDHNVDIDRGGTADPDKFIYGPAERSADYSIDFSWDLADLLWSGDQTTIDNRSKLMVQLRDDLLSQLNHLYFSRRRLQVEATLIGAGDLKGDLERELQLQEYAAGLDALTGGWFSRKVSESAHVEIGTSR